MTSDGEKVHFDNLLKKRSSRPPRSSTSPGASRVFKDNAGVIEFDEQYAVCFKVETHNHPSALEPYGGAATGIGGVIRDPMGTGLGAKPIANTDSSASASRTCRWTRCPRACCIRGG